MQKSSLTALAEQHLAVARGAASGRSAHTVLGGRRSTLRQTLIALLAGQRLAEHENPGEATLQVLHGTVRMSTADGADVAEAAQGELLVVPDTRHDLEALADSVILLTVAKLAAEPG